MFRFKSPILNPSPIGKDFETLIYLQICPGGEIGRRTVFRSQRSQGCAGSNPVPGTFKRDSKLRIPLCTHFFYNTFIIKGTNNSAHFLYCLPEGCKPSYAIKEGSFFASLEIGVISI